MNCRCGRALKPFIEKSAPICQCCYEPELYCSCSTEGTQDLCSKHDRALKEASPHRRPTLPPRPYEPDIEPALEARRFNPVEIALRWLDARG